MTYDNGVSSCRGGKNGRGCADEIPLRLVAVKATTYLA